MSAGRAPTNQPRSVATYRSAKPLDGRWRAGRPWAGCTERRSERVIEVWILDRGAHGASPERLEALLTPEERARRDRFRRPEDQDRFRLGRALCRLALARRLDRPAADIGLEIGPRGRPFLRGAPDGPWFNLSHSGDIVALAVAPVAEIGVDVEQVDRLHDSAQIAARVCTDAEQSALQAHPPQARAELFAALWTLKEAYMKATGMGFALDPAALAFDPDRPTTALKLAGLAPEDIAAWRFQLWRPAPGYSLALAIRPTPGAALPPPTPASAAPLFQAFG